MKTGFICSVGTIAGLLLCVGMAPNAYSQNAILNFSTSAMGHGADEVISTFTFNRALILNDVGFVYQGVYGDGDFAYSYKINNEEWQSVGTDSILLGNRQEADVNGVRYLTFSNPTTYASGTTVKVRTEFRGSNPQRWWSRFFYSDNADFGVTHSTTRTDHAAGNIRVSNPSANVAPEPGSFALALTGGAALMGICIRRRRNAA